MGGNHLASRFFRHSQLDEPSTTIHTYEVHNLYKEYGAHVMSIVTVLGENDIFHLEVMTRLNQGKN